LRASGAAATVQAEAGMSDSFSEVVRISQGVFHEVAGLLPTLPPSAVALGAVALGPGAGVASRAQAAAAAGSRPSTLTDFAEHDGLLGAYGAIAEDAASSPGAAAVLNVSTPGGGE
jgi:hypothetical protein